MITELKQYVFIFSLSAMALCACKTQQQAQNGDGSELSSTPASAQDDTIVIERNFIDGIRAKELGDNESAITFFKEVLKADAENDAALFELANIYFNFGRLEDARELARIAAQKKPSNKYYQQFYAEVLTYLAQYTDAAKVYEALIKNNPADIETVFQLSYVYEKAGDISNAIKTLENLEKNYGEEENILAEQERLLVKSGQIDKAIQVVNKLIVINPYEPSYFGMLTELYESVNNADMASLTFKKLLELDPDNPDLLFRQANYNLKDGNIPAYFSNLRKAFSNPEANIDRKIFFLIPYVDSIENKNFILKDSVLTWTELLVKAHPSDAKAYAMRGDFLFYTNQLNEARINYAQSLVIQSNIYDVWQKMFYIDADLHQYDSLQQVTQEAIELFPNKPLSYYFNAVALNHLKQNDDAIKVLKRTIPITLSDMNLRADIYQLLGDIYHEMKNDAESDNAYENSLQINPDNAYTLNNYAYYLSLRAQDLDKAAQMAQYANQLKPGDASLLDTYGWILYKQGKYAEAKTQLENAIQHGGSTSGLIIEHYGDILFKSGAEDAALENWIKAKALGNTSGLIDKKIADKKLYE